MVEEIAQGVIEVFSRLAIDGLVRGFGYLIRRYILFQRREFNFFGAWTFITGIIGWAIILPGLYWIIAGQL